MEVLVSFNRGVMLKVFEIYNKDTKETFFIHNKEKFCNEYNLTRRLLDYTYTGQRNHHKGFIIKQKLEFIPSLDGDKKLLDSDLLGYFVYPVEYDKNNKEKNAEKINYYVDKHNIDKITLAFTGDLINLDSHMDSLLSNEDNRANSFVEALDTLVEFINSIKSNVNSVSVVGVTGNESRIRTFEYHSNVDKIANNNFDMLLCKILKRLFKNTNVWFINECNVLNYVFKIGRFNIAITHGDKLGKQSKDDILKFKTRMIEATNNPVDYVIFGHIHESLITSTYSRSGSLCGMDSYAYNGLNICNGISSQNIYLIQEDGITGIEIKL